MKKTGVSEIAKALDMSPTTVSRALSGKGRVSEETRAKVNQYIEQNNIEPIVRNKKYTAPRTKNILVTIPKEEDYALLPFFSETISSVYDYFSLQGYQVIYGKTEENDISVIEELVKKKSIDGVILTRVLQEAKDIKYLRSMNVPFVVIGTYDDRSVYQVDVDQCLGCRDLTSVLLRMGVRNVALFCADRTQMVTKQRMRGFLQAYEDNGLNFDTNMVFDNTEKTFMTEGYIDDILKKGVECILCMDDNICTIVLNVLRKIGVRVPQDIKIATFFNSRILDECYPTISCVDFNIGELGMAASKMLLDILNNKNTKERIILGYNVVLKESTK